MSVSKNEPVDEVNGNREAREQPRLPWESSGVGGLVAVQESECSGTDEQRSRKNRETAESNHNGRENEDDQDEGNNFGFGVHGISSRWE